MRMKRSAGLLGLCLALLPAAACLDEDITGTRALAITITADPTAAAVGDDVRFEFVGEGTNIAAVVVGFGDGQADTLTYPAVVEVADFTVHSYDAPGTYTAIATVVAVNGRLSDEVVVTVSQPFE